MDLHGPCECCHAAVPPSRRAIIAVLGGAAAAQFAGPFFAAIAAAQSSSDDERFMRLALDEARRADFPFGAVIVHNGKVIARGRNLGRTNRDPTAHGEMIAIRCVVAGRGGAALRGTTIYTMGEPCVMCMGAILWSHIGRLVFAASLKQLATRIDQIMISSEEVAAATPFAPISITGGVLADDAMALFERK